MSDIAIQWDEPRQGTFRAFGADGRVLGRVHRVPSSTECTAHCGYDDLGAYVSEEFAKKAVERRLNARKVPT